MLSGSKSLSGTRLRVTTTAQVGPRMAREVCWELLIALKAYSTWYKRPSGEKRVIKRLEGRRRQLWLSAFSYEGSYS